MSKFPVWGGAVALCLAFGCGPGKELPTAVERPDNSVGQQQPVPSKSDPEAKAVINDAVKAVTGGKPELLAKGKASRVTLKGVVLMPLDSTPQEVETVRTISAVWPDRFYGLNEATIRGNKWFMKAYMHRPQLHVFENDLEQRAANPAELEQSLASDVVAQQWMTFLLPATDSKAIVYNLEQVTMEKHSLNIVKLAIGEYPIYTLTFDAKSRLLQRVEYSNRQATVLGKNLWLFSDYQPHDGLLLPTKLEYRRDNTMREKWTVEKWEFPAAIKDEEFLPPPPKK